MNEFLYIARTDSLFRMNLFMVDYGFSTDSFSFVDEEILRR